MHDATQAQVMEALNLLQEECAEIIQIISKIRRFGFKSYHPDDPSTTNHRLLNDEVGDFEVLKNYLIGADILDPVMLGSRMAYKRAKLKQYSNLFKED